MTVQPAKSEDRAFLSQFCLWLVDQPQEYMHRGGSYWTLCWWDPDQGRYRDTDINGAHVEALVKEFLDQVDYDDETGE